MSVCTAETCGKAKFNRRSARLKNVVCIQRRNSRRSQITQMMVEPRQMRDSENSRKETSRKLKFVGKPARLKTNDGQYVCIQRKRDSGSHQMVVETRQNSDPEDSSKVTVYYLYNVGHDKRKYMAFCFEVEKNYYFPIVTKGPSGRSEAIHFSKVLSPEDMFAVSPLDKGLLFQWGEKVGHWKSLKSVAEPSKYLDVADNKVKISSHAALFRIEIK